MMTHLRNGIGIPALGGFIPQGLPGHNEQLGYSYQPEKAKNLIEAYKTESGNLEPTITLTTTSNYLSFSEFIQRELQSIGLTISILPLISETELYKSCKSVSSSCSENL